MTRLACPVLAVLLVAGAARAADPARLRAGVGRSRGRRGQSAHARRDGHRPRRLPASATTRARPATLRLHHRAAALADAGVRREGTRREVAGAARPGRRQRGGAGDRLRVRPPARDPGARGEGREAGREGVRARVPHGRGGTGPAGVEGEAGPRDGRRASRRCGSATTSTPPGSAPPCSSRTRPRRSKAAIEQATPSDRSRASIRLGATPRRCCRRARSRGCGSTSRRSRKPSRRRTSSTRRGRTSSRPSAPGHHRLPQAVGLRRRRALSGADGLPAASAHARGPRGTVGRSRPARPAEGRARVARRRSNRPARSTRRASTSTPATCGRTATGSSTATRSGIEKGEKEISKILPTTVKFGELLEMWGPHHRVVVANHDARPYKTEPA